MRVTGRRRRRALAGLAVVVSTLSAAGCGSAAVDETLTFRLWDEQAADRHGRLRARLRGLGAPIGDFDEMIAAHALSLGAVLVTDNVRHFERVGGLVIENWVRAG